MTDHHPFSTVLSAWNEPNAEARTALVERSVSSEFVYDDVHRDEPITSRAAFVDFLAQFRANVSGITVSLNGTPEVLRNTARFRFTMDKAGTRFSEGTYFATLDQNGKIMRMVGFIDVEPGG